MDLMQIRRNLMMQMVEADDGNLFKWNVPFQNPDDTTSSNTTKRIFTPKTYCIGNSYSNWFVPSNVIHDGGYTCSISNGEISITPFRGHYGPTFPISVNGGESYVLAYQRSSTDGFAANAFYDAEGNYISGNSYINSGVAFTIPASATICTIMFVTNAGGRSATFSDIYLAKN